MITDTIGVAMSSFNRPNCLRGLLQSLEAQTHLENTDFHLWQDGAVNVFSGTVWADPADVVACVDVFNRSGLPNKSLHVQRQNVGAGINQFGAIEHMTANYEYMVLVEDDVVLSPHWLRLVRVLLGQVREREDVFSFSLGFRKLCPKEEAEQNLDRLVYGTAHWWGEALVSARWLRARPHFLEYYELIRECDYRHLPHRAITDLYRRKGWPQTAISQDGGYDMSVYAAGMKRLCTVVNRGISTGEHGVHFRPKLFREMGFDRQGPYEFEGDATLKEFVLPE